MKITGYKLREAIKEWELRREGATESFNNSLTKFEDELKDSPDAVASEIELCDKSISKLQTAQSAYNLSIKVDLGNEQISLCEAVKRVGGAERMEKMWRNAMRMLVPRSSGVRNIYSAQAEVKMQEASLVMTQAQAREKTSSAAKTASKLRSMIAAANSVEVDITDLSPDLFS